VPQLVCQPAGGFIGACSVSTLVQGNAVGGRLFLGNSGPIASDASAAAMATALEAAGLGAVSVQRSAGDGRGGYSWSVTFTEVQGNMTGLSYNSELTGYGVTVDIASADGNELGGVWSLSLGGEQTAPLPYDATAAEVKAQLELLSTVGTVTVTRSADAKISPEGGSVYTVTFIDTSNPGDVQPLQASFEDLTGDGAAVLVRELVKGSESSGTSAKLSFEAPLNCATAQVVLGQCGDAVDFYSVEWDTSASFTSAGKVTTTLNRPDLLTEVCVQLQELAAYTTVLTLSTVTTAIADTGIVINTHAILSTIYQ
jgi:hypothetical protein